MKTEKLLDSTKTVIGSAWKDCHALAHKPCKSLPLLLSRH